MFLPLRRPFLPSPPPDTPRSRPRRHLFLLLLLPLALSLPAPPHTPFRVLFLSVLRRFSLFFRLVRSLKTGSSRARLHRAGRPAGPVGRPISLALTLTRLVRSRSRSFVRSSRVSYRRDRRRDWRWIVVGSEWRRSYTGARALVRTYFIAQTSEHVYRSLEYSGVSSPPPPYHGSHRVYIYVTPPLYVTIGGGRCSDRYFFTRRRSSSARRIFARARAQPVLSFGSLPSPLGGREEKGERGEKGEG